MGDEKFRLRVSDEIILWYPFHDFCIFTEPIWSFSSISPNDLLRESSQCSGDHFRLCMMHRSDHRSHWEYDKTFVCCVNPIRQFWIIFWIFLQVFSADCWANCIIHSVTKQHESRNDYYTVENIPGFDRFTAGLQWKPPINLTLGMSGLGYSKAKSVRISHIELSETKSKNPKNNCIT